MPDFMLAAIEPPSPQAVLQSSPGIEGFPDATEFESPNRFCRFAIAMLAETGFGKYSVIRSRRIEGMVGQETSASRGIERVKISDVAVALSLTKGTVSRALNGYPDISESTRLKVRNAARRMGYVPLSHAQAIKTGRVRSLGIVWRVDSHDGHRAFLSDFLDGVSRAVSAEDWSLTVSTADSDIAERTTLSRLLKERKVDGFILPRTLADDQRVEWLRNEEAPFILYGRVASERNCSWFDFRGEDAMRKSVARLAELGHERIAFVNGDLRFNYALLRRDGYFRGLADAGIDPDPDLVLDGAMTLASGETATRKLLRLESPPTGIVFAQDMAALGAYRAAEKTGVSIGRELSVIGYDGVPEGAWASPQLSTFAVDSRWAGQRLAALLIDQIRGGNPEDLRETGEARFLSRGSDCPPAASGGNLADFINLENHYGGQHEHQL